MKFFLIVIALLSATAARAEMPSAVKLLEEGEGSKFTEARGTATWKLAPRNDHGPAAEVVVAADVVIPERDIKLVIIMYEAPPGFKNASHFFEVHLVPRDFARVNGVSAIPGILAEPGQIQRGSPLAIGQTRADVASFLIGISDPPERRGYSLQLINENDFLTFPLYYGNKTMALLQVQKGPSGNAAFTQAFSAWGLRPMKNPIMKSMLVKRLGTPENSPQMEAMQAIRNQVMACWPTPKVDPPSEVSILVHYNIDGTLFGEPEVVPLPDGTATPEATAIAIEAMKKCQPVKMKGPFENWRTMEVVFGGR